MKDPKDYGIQQNTTTSSNASRRWKSIGSLIWWTAIVIGFTYPILRHINLNHFPPFYALYDQWGSVLASLASVVYLAVRKAIEPIHKEMAASNGDQSLKNFAVKNHDLLTEILSSTNNNGRRIDTVWSDLSTHEVRLGHLEDMISPINELLVWKKAQEKEDRNPTV